jgi:hypothetical protein
MLFFCSVPDTTQDLIIMLVNNKNRKVIYCVSAVNTLVAFYNIHGTKGEMPFFCSVPDTTRNFIIMLVNNKNEKVIYATLEN